MIFGVHRVQSEESLGHATPCLPAIEIDELDIVKIRSSSERTISLDSILRMHGYRVNQRRLIMIGKERRHISVPRVASVLPFLKTSIFSTTVPRLRFTIEPHVFQLRLLQIAL
jgi:hypothetical protein